MQRLFWLQGHREPHVFEVLDSIVEEHGAKWFQDTACLLLRGLGYCVDREVLVPNRGDGKRGRVDIVAAKPFILIAIELDHTIPRRKSIFKVQQIKGATMRLVYCRRAANEARVRKYLERRSNQNK